MGAKFGMYDAEDMGDGRKAFVCLGAVSVRDRKLREGEGMNDDPLVELPKLDVAGSIPVARSRILSQIQ